MEGARRLFGRGVVPLSDVDAAHGELRVRLDQVLKPRVEDVTGAAPLRPVVDQRDLSGDDDLCDVDLFALARGGDVERPADVLGQRLQVVALFPGKHGLVPRVADRGADLFAIESVGDAHRGGPGLPVELRIANAGNALERPEDRRRTRLAVDADDGEGDGLRGGQRERNDEGDQGESDASGACHGRRNSLMAPSCHPERSEGPAR